MPDMQAKRQRGAVAIESTLMFPLLVLLIFGMIEFGLLLYNRQVLANASREGARAGIVSTLPGSPVTDSDISDVVDEYCTARLITFGSAGGPSTAVTREGSADCPLATRLAVRATYQYDFLVLTRFGFGPIQLEAQTVMRCE